jgi:hypothetical protein
MCLSYQFLKRRGRRKMKGRVFRGSSYINRVRAGKELKKPYIFLAFNLKFLTRN